MRSSSSHSTWGIYQPGIPAAMSMHITGSERSIAGVQGPNRKSQDSEAGSSKVESGVGWMPRKDTKQRRSTTHTLASAQALHEQPVGPRGPQCGQSSIEISRRRYAGATPGTSSPLEVLQITVSVSGASSSDTTTLGTSPENGVLSFTTTEASRTVVTPVS